MALDERLREIHAMHADLMERLARQGGTDGGGGSGMETRVGRIEGRIDTLSDRMSDVREELAGLKERVAHLPSKGFIVTTVVTSLTVFGLVVAFGEKLLKALG